jgi:hypothetical protein
MNESSLNLIKIIFLFGFTLHNLEEAVWLPRWSKYAEKFHAPVKSDQFIFAVIVVTLIGYLLAALDFLLSSPGNLVNYAWLGFVGMMGLNSIFPHLLATIVLKKYAPGLFTGLFLNLPLSLVLIIFSIKSGINIFYLQAAILAVGGSMLFSLKYVFRLGSVFIDF